ncbi:fimbria/pilus periplasmic chaperone [Klebsiella michiganensis]|uniref:fimbrial biogenesis chaperone n=1 Tax=Klebsiella/Raoultella group TaxID=2890311 RepID=UPI001034D319|nr:MULTISPECIES: fimbria/pilus periplasmic chaperone [Klebsiella/Raoultella group]MCF6692622.1 fimbria/pilus periplasmic chaperone [Raoultella terrigena]MEB4603268.1 fimbria/pilus periplasmic chaperone [Raoultella ornithinolytica]MEB7602152.1 fimbria/pilus periplasmic chaperone [Raoultella terrigena]MEB8081404.1 fimbria/pilus periplasmic chaperone [Klebsiella michiganensis]
MTGKTFVWRYIFASIIVFIFSFQTKASLVITGTRIIYYSDQKEVTVKVDNIGKNPSLYQSWIDNGDADISPDKIDVPFVITPPIGRINQNKGQSLRLVYTGKGQPTDRESVFWFNVLEIMAENNMKVTDQNVLKLAFRSRIKLFYRPASLKQNVSFKGHISLSIVGNNLNLQNNSPYYFSLVRIESENGNKQQEFKGVMISPLDNQIINVERSNEFTFGTPVTVYYIDDYGAEVGIQLTIH